MVLAHSSSWRRLFQIPVLLLALVAPASAAELAVPLTLPLEVLTQAFTPRLTAADGGPATLYQEGPCRRLTAGGARLEFRDGKLRLLTDGAASLGVSLLGKCTGLKDWRGTISADLEPYIGSDWKLRYRVTSTDLHDERGKHEAIMAFTLNLARRFMRPLLESVTFDLAPPRDEILQLVRAAAGAETVSEVEAVAASLALGTPQADADGLHVPLQFTLPDASVQAPAGMPTAEAVLSTEELAAIAERLQPWDAFVVFVIKRLGMDTADAQIGERLFDLLLSTRYRMVEILAGEDAAAGADPVRTLFVETWDSLRGIVHDAQRRGLLQGRALAYLTFVNAADALLALDREAPALGLQVSEDGLRRLARTLYPTLTTDPLAYDWALDPELRTLFGFAPEPAQVPSENATGARLLQWLVRSAHAAESGDERIAALRRRLDHWLPASDELAEYRGIVAELLRLTTDERLRASSMSEPHAQIYRNLIPTTALIESCWRHYMRKSDEITFLRSQAGSVGLMQINQHVWRGFYDVERLKWDAPYNARAGAEILMQYMQRYGTRVAAETGNADHIPRAAYSVYNAGPRALKRFLSEKATARERRVDDRLWRLYQGIAGGGQVDLTTCAVQAAGR